MGRDFLADYENNDMMPQDTVEGPTGRLDWEQQTQGKWKNKKFPVNNPGQPGPDRHKAKRKDLKRYK